MPISMVHLMQMKINCKNSHIKLGIINVEKMFSEINKQRHYYVYLFELRSNKKKFLGLKTNKLRKFYLSLVGKVSCSSFKL